MNSFRKLVVVLALVTLSALASSSTAHTAASPTFYQGAVAVKVCGCCPRTCAGGTFIGCYNTIFMPPNAVTCTYVDAGGNAFDCVSCLN